MNQPVITAKFAKDLETCTITITQGIDSHTYYDLRVKKFNLRDYKEPEMLYVVKIPCAAALGQNYMAAFGKDFIFGYQHPERTELVFHTAPVRAAPKSVGRTGVGVHELSDEDAMPKMDKRKKSKPSNQLSLFEGE